MILSFWSIAADERAKCVTMMEGVRRARRHASRADFPSNVRVPGGTGLATWIGSEMRADRTHRAFTSYVESLSAKYHCADIDWRSFSP